MIVAKQVSVSFGSTQVLDSVDFSCKRGEFVALVGASGTGKSTFLNAVAALIPFGGAIQVSGSIGYVFQSYALFPWMTVEQNIRFALQCVAEESKRQRSKELLERIDLLPLSGRYPRQLSGGQVQRVALARALASDPEILLMDEPYAALDHHTRERMQQWLLSVWESERKSVVFVTHYIEEATYLADRIVVLRQGRFCADVPVPFERPRREDIRFEQAFLDVKHTVLRHMETAT